MKINTDGVLLGALVTADKPEFILDIGTGTGVIAMMLAQRFDEVGIHAVEIDESAASTAAYNFRNSPFANRLSLHPLGFQGFFAAYPGSKYDLIVSNPPFYINSLLSPGAKKNQAKHAGDGFFEELMQGVSYHLTSVGVCWLVLPPDTAALVKELAVQQGLYLQKIIYIHSFEADVPHREIVAFGLQSAQLREERLVIYDEPKVYSASYTNALKNFLTIF